LHEFFRFLTKSDQQRAQQIILAKVTLTPIPQAPPVLTTSSPDLNFAPPASYSVNTPQSTEPQSNLDNAPPPMRKAIRPNEIPDANSLHLMQSIVELCKLHGFRLYIVLREHLGKYNPSFQFLNANGKFHRFFDYLLLKNEVFDLEYELNSKIQLEEEHKQSSIDLDKQLDENKKAERTLKAKQLMMQLKPTQPGMFQPTQLLPPPSLAPTKSSFCCSG